jgi:hypothetical protein
LEQRCTASACKDGVNAALVSGRQRRIGLSQPPQALGLVDEGGLPPGLAIDFTNDLLGTARILAAALRREQFDLILLGQQAADSECYVMAGLVAELLELPCVTQAASIELSDGAVTVKRQVETGYDTVKATMPCVVSQMAMPPAPTQPSRNCPSAPMFHTLAR